MFKPPSIPRVPTWTLWKRLVFPPAHPLFKRASRTAPPGVRNGAWLAWLAPLVGGLTCCGTWLVLLKARSAAPVFLLLATGMASTVYAGLWAMETGVAIARERIHNTYDVLCATPAGALGVHWALCAASLHRRELLDTIEALRRATTLLLTFTFLLIALLTASQERALDLAVFLPLLLELMSMTAATYLDHVQATVLGSLVGMSVPLLAEGLAMARLWAGLGFLALQCGALVATLLSVALATPLLPPAISPLVFGLAVFFLIREGLVIGLWRALARHLSADPVRIDLALG